MVYASVFDLPEGYVAHNERTREYDRAYSRAYRLRYKAATRAYYDAWRKTPAGIRSRKKQSDSIRGLAPEEREKAAIAREKAESCEICGANGRLCVDHDHRTRKFRGMLCSKCNAGLGMFGDSISTLTSAVCYLSSRT